MSLPNNKLPNSRGCFVCGRENSIGLKLQFEKDGDGVSARLTPGRDYQGFGGVLHGGIIAALLDDAMWYAIFAAADCAPTMTAGLDVRYKKAAPVEAEVKVYAEVEEARGKLFAVRGVLTGPDGEVLAEGKGKFLKAPKEIADRLLAELGDRKVE